MNQFPAFFFMTDRHAVVFGGGETARRKVRLLVKSPARVIVVADEIDADFAEELGGQIEVRGKRDGAQALIGAVFAIVAIADDADAVAAIALVRAANVPLNAVDRPEHCDFTVPSILDRGDIVAGIATGGAAPVLAKSVRAKLETLMPQRIGDLAALAKAFRPSVYAALDDEGDRRRFWEAALNGKAAELAFAGDLEGAQAEFETLLAGGIPQGVVHIVGAGPGDPELLTVKALRLIQNADIVYFDRLVSDGIMDLVRRDATRVPVGKSKGDHLVPQTDIHDLLVASAKAGKRVVRLKGGDPFIFGRGGEELQALQAEGIEAHVVPGISSALGCAASAGIPLTHRDHAQSLTFVTGHAKAGGVPDLDWKALARTNQTVVVFMGVGTSADIASGLIGAGRAPSTPVAVIENGTRETEIRAFGTLAGLAQLITRNSINGPALLIIGEVAALPPAATQTLPKETAA